MKKETPVPIRTFTESHRVDLTHEEKITYALTLAAEQGRLLAAENFKEEATKMHNSTIKTHESKCAELAVKVNQGWEFRDVEVDELEDWDGKRIIHVRRDTGQIVFHRPMSEQERQPRLPVS